MKKKIFYFEEKLQNIKDSEQNILNICESKKEYNLLEKVLNLDPFRKSKPSLESLGLDLELNRSKKNCQFESKLKMVKQNSLPITSFENNKEKLHACEIFEDILRRTEKMNKEMEERQDFQMDYGELLNRTFQEKPIHHLPTESMLPMNNDYDNLINIRMNCIKNTSENNDVALFENCLDSEANLIMMKENRSPNDFNQKNKKSELKLNPLKKMNQKTPRKHSYSPSKYKQNLYFFSLKYLEC